MARKRREDVIELTREKILAAARRLMAQRGTAGLSIREIARAIEMTPPALYYYFPSLDDIISTLILEAFNALAEALEMTRDGMQGTARQKILAVCMAYRAWALAHRVDFELIYGNPIPGYHAPAELTVPAAKRGGDVLVDLIYDALVSGELRPHPPYQEAPSRMADHLRTTIGADNPDLLLAIYLMTIGWTRIHGMIMLELFEHLGPLAGDLDTYYRLQVENMLTDFGLSP